MAKKSTEKTGKYLYALVFASEDRQYGPIGIDGSLVYTISDGHVAAIVSDLPDEKIRPERRHIAAHQAVLKKLLEEGAPLPMSFGIIADGPKSIRKILALNQKAFLNQLHRISGKLEMGLRVIWDVPNIFDYFVKTHPELRSVRDRLFGHHRGPTHEEKIELGRMFDRLLIQDREIYTDMVEKVLTRYCSELKLNKCLNEREVMNLSCLVERDKQVKFEAGVFEAARIFDDSFAFDYNGPWAPHNFVDIDLRL